ncbi:MAG: O-succinylhomoserine sulfhydrylase [Tetrasphaera jenkinsii]|jgi:O-succinylhomoserine sulfhydrylase|uniref:O-succinylhomoserine sulfhydrylase n=1 Tax=Nostocoides jenkinsii Ben 74 TaxID=1193518 RepID=A0A077MF93_9MICO|nr:O-succinylhomoserine sulfhydrylase [Tetrasphaera jenkinsii]MCI1262648.1 O-succinylhomoserine sulfhydrylase [Tetrasphaera jenkinsii]CCI53862.1 O-succinylhomoserine sulfhydrylase [Tetrasphaera jenkinsii Ben 74]
MADLTSRPLRRDTLAVRGGLMRSQFEETSEALFLTSGYVYSSAAEAEATFKEEVERYSYSRYHNPTVTMFEQRLAALEGAEACYATPTGMSAVFAVLAGLCAAGDRIVASKALFGTCYTICADVLPRWGVEAVFVDGTDLAAWREALSVPTTAVFFETPSNPTMTLVDIAAVSELAHAAGATVVVDNVFGTPLFSTPLALGADIVVYSSTKHIDGQGRILGGAVLGREQQLREVVRPMIRNLGLTLSAFNAWVLVKSLETMDLRLRAQSNNAQQVAEWFEARPEVVNVCYPGLASHPQAELARRQMSGYGTVVTFTVDADKAATFRVLDALEIVDISNNLGDTKSLITHPATTTHSRFSAEELADMGITAGTMRLSVGLEDPLDLIEDLERAFAAIAQA